MKTQRTLLGLLADGELHSGNELAEALGVSRTAVWKHIRQLETLDVEVTAQAGQGYRLSEPLQLLDSEAILAAMNPDARELLGGLELLWVTESTNDYLLSMAGADGLHAVACVAEYQTGGRGRRGRQWYAPAGDGICLSVGWKFTSAPASLSCLGLAVGVGVLRGLLRAGLRDAQLKWPNDIVLDDAKLAGILIDVQGEAGGPLHAVAGIGLNYKVSAPTRAAIKQAGGTAPAQLAGTQDGMEAGRNEVAGAIISEVLLVLRQFAEQGFDALLAEWRAADSLSGRRVAVLTDTETVNGLVRGVSADGLLQVEVNGQLRELLTGDVSVRAAA